jgi:hypothetical protein
MTCQLAQNSSGVALHAMTSSLMMTHFAGSMGHIQRRTSGSPSGEKLCQRQNSVPSSARLRADITMNFDLEHTVQYSSSMSGTFLLGYFGGSKNMSRSTQLRS